MSGDRPHLKGMLPRSWTTGGTLPPSSYRHVSARGSTGPVTPGSPTLSDAEGLQSWRAVQTLIEETLHADRQDLERAKKLSVDTELAAAAGGAGITRSRTTNDGSEPSHHAGPSGSSYLTRTSHTPTESPSNSSFIFGLGDPLHPHGSTSSPHKPGSTKASPKASPATRRLPSQLQHPQNQQRVTSRRVTPKTSLLSVFSPLQQQQQHPPGPSSTPPSAKSTPDPSAIHLPPSGISTPSYLTGSLVGTPLPHSPTHDVPGPRGDYFHSPSRTKHDEPSGLGIAMLSSSPPSLYHGPGSGSGFGSRDEMPSLAGRMLASERRDYSQLSSGDEQEDEEAENTPVQEHRARQDSVQSGDSASTVRPGLGAQGLTFSQTSVPRSVSGNGYGAGKSRAGGDGRAQNGAGEGSVMPEVKSKGRLMRERVGRIAYSISHPPLWVQQVLKCALAYTLASMFTFVPFLSGLLSTSSETDVHGRVVKKPAYSAHMVATVMVYFHPARTKGGMILASKYCVILAGFAALVCSMAIFTLEAFDRIFPENSVGEEIGDWVVLVAWIGGSMGMLAWLKQWVNNPSFNTGCSMAAVTLFTVVIKEGGWDKLLEVVIIVACGATISNFVCYAFWPVSATDRLQTSIKTTLDSFQTLLGLLSATFLLDRPPTDTTQESLAVAVKAHTAAFTKLKADLDEAKHESIIDKRIRKEKQERYRAVIESLTRLAQHLTGMRGGVRMQAELLMEAATSTSDEADDDVKGEEGQNDQVGEREQIQEIFFEFREAVGPTLRDLTRDCCRALAVTQAAISDRFDELEDVHEQIEASLASFRDASTQAVTELFGRFSLQGLVKGLDKSAPQEDQGGDGGVTSSTAETMFLLYFFLFTFEEFARETVSLMELLREMHSPTPPPSTIFSRFAQRFKKKQPREPIKKRSMRDFRKRLATIVPLDPSGLQPRIFPSKHSKKGNTLTHPSSETLMGRDRWLRKVWSFQERLRQPDIKYAVKTGLGSVILASPAFIQWMRPVFLEYRGEWAMIAYWATMSPSIGATNILSVYRIAGTILGAVVAVVIYTLFPDDRIVLPIFGFFFSMPCFWIVTQRPSYQQASRFILLTYNLTCLYAFNNRQRDLTAFDIGWRRSCSVIIGVLWAGFVSTCWWPYAARKELRIGLSDFCIDLSYLYSKLVGAYSGQHDETCVSPPGTEGSHPSEQTPLLSHQQMHDHQAVLKQFLSMELHLQIELLKLRGLLAQTVNEPRLKGPFPYAMYDGVLASCQNVLDKFHSMRCVTTRREWDLHIHRNYIKPVNPQRREMVSNVILYFYLLAAAFRLRTPLPPALPPAEKARERLVKAILQLHLFKEPGSGVGGGNVADERQWLYFAYALAMQGVIEELQFLGETLQGAFGIINQSTTADFEALFA